MYFAFKFNSKMSLILCLKFIKILILVFISFVATNSERHCIVGRLGICNWDEKCLRFNESHPIGRCVCRDSNNCLNNNKSQIITTLKPLPIYSIDDKSSNSSVIIHSILGTMASISIILLSYYFGVRKGLFRGIWRRAFTQRTIEHQLLDRSPQYSNNNIEAIALIWYVLWSNPYIQMRVTLC